MHTIRLRGPWHVEAIERLMLDGDGTYRGDCHQLPPAARQKMPREWSEVLGHDYLGRVCYLRTFQKPTGLDDGERVFLVVEPPRSSGSIGLNDRPLGEVRFGQPAARFDITPHLEEHNRLEIVVSHPALDDSGRPIDDNNTNLAGGLVGEIRLEIED